MQRPVRCAAHCPAYGLCLDFFGGLMMSSSGNPYSFPDMPGSGNQANPLMQSLEMMRQAWSHLNPSTMQGQLQPQALLDPSEIDRRITELQAVENWLNLNLNMVQTSIRALEVQRATLGTLRSFASMGSQFGAAPSAEASGPSPLEVALGLKPAPAPEPQPEPASKATQTPGSSRAAPQAPAGAEPAAQTGAGFFADPAQAAAAQQAWWNMLQQQFNQVASAAAASLAGQPPAANNDPNTPKDSAKKTASAAASTSKTPARKAASKASSSRKSATKAASKATSKAAKRSS